MEKVQIPVDKPNAHFSSENLGFRPKHERLKTDVQVWSGAIVQHVGACLASG